MYNGFCPSGTLRALYSKKEWQDSTCHPHKEGEILAEVTVDGREFVNGSGKDGVPGLPSGREIIIHPLPAN